MKKLILKCEGMCIDKFTIPPFDLYEGELITLFLYGGAHFQGLKTALVDIFTGKTKNSACSVIEALTYVGGSPFKENSFKQLFFPATIDSYIKSKNIENNSIAKRIYNLNGITPKRKVCTLGCTERKLLYLYTTLSDTNKIVFDFLGQDLRGSIETFNIVEEFVLKGGAVILLDCFENEDIQKRSTKYLKITGENGEEIVPKKVYFTLSKT
jgi:hypothetical protein